MSVQLEQSKSGKYSNAVLLNMPYISETCERSKGGTVTKLKQLWHIPLALPHDDRSNGGNSIRCLDSNRNVFMFVTAEVSKDAMRYNEVQPLNIPAIFVTPVVFAATTSNKSTWPINKLFHATLVYVKSHTLGEELTWVPVPFANVGVMPSVNLRRIVYGGRTIGGSHPTPFPLKPHVLFPNFNQ